LVRRIGPYAWAMATQAAAPPAPPLDRPGSLRLALSSVVPTWSRVAALRALRTTIVVPSLFAFSTQVLANNQIATFAAFGGFATLMLASFGGTRRDKLIAHIVLAAAGGLLVLLGTAVSEVTPLAAGVAALVTFVVLFAGIAGANASSGATAVLLAFVLAAASKGAISSVSSREAGWWMASAVGTLAVLALSPRPAGDGLRSSAASLADVLADELGKVVVPSARTAEGAQRMTAAKQALTAAFAAAPYRPTGLAVTDQALAALVEDLAWAAAVACDAMGEGSEMTAAAEVDLKLLRATASVFREIARLLGGEETRPLVGDLEQMEGDSASAITALSSGTAGSEQRVHISFHARMVAAAARSAALDAMIATRRVPVEEAVNERARWHGAAGLEEQVLGRSRVLLEAFRRRAGGNANVRSVWFLNSARGAMAIAAAVTVTDLTNVQHGFWVVLGTLSVLRTNAASTGATALRALLGTAVGFFIGAALLIAIGGDHTALWVALPVAALLAGYAPGTTPFAVGQAFFTVAIVVLINILAPVGWRVGVVRFEDVAIGAGVSMAAGLLFWPRGAGRVVGDDLAEAFHWGGVYLVQATAWALGSRGSRPDAGQPAVSAALRLDDALRAFQAEQGAKPVPKQELAHLVNGTMRLRLTAQSLASVGPHPAAPAPERRALVEESVVVAGLCDDLAGRLGKSSVTAAQELAAVLAGDGEPMPAEFSGYGLWAQEHLSHIRGTLAEMQGPADEVSSRRRQPWWR